MRFCIFSPRLLSPLSSGLTRINTLAAPPLKIRPICAFAAARQAHIVREGIRAFQGSFSGVQHGVVQHWRPALDHLTLAYPGLWRRQTEPIFIALSHKAQQWIINATERSSPGSATSGWGRSPSVNFVENWRRRSPELMLCVRTTASHLRLYAKGLAKDRRSRKSAHPLHVDTHRVAPIAAAF